MTMISRLFFAATILFGTPLDTVLGFSSLVGVERTSSYGTMSSTATALSAINNRREFLLSTTVAGAALAATILSTPQPAFADVSDGNTLPQGAQQFSRVIRVKSDLKAVQKRVKEAASEMDSKEWDNVSQFLRQVYQTSDDMKAIAGGIYDPEKKKQALVDAEDIKKIARATDVPVSKQDGGGFMAAAKKMDDIYEDFLEQLRDVPDEL